MRSKSARVTVSVQHSIRDLETLGFKISDSIIALGKPYKLFSPSVINILEFPLTQYLY